MKRLILIAAVLTDHDVHREPPPNPSSRARLAELIKAMGIPADETVAPIALLEGSGGSGDAFPEGGSMKRLIPALAALLLALSAAANAAGTISYGSRVGMEVTVVSVSGIGTAHAVIRVKHTRENAKTFCVEYSQDQSEDCVNRELRIPLNDELVGNCETGWFTSLYGERLRFVGEAKKHSEFGPKYIILKDRQPLDGSSASGYGYNLEQFEALCPARASGDD